MPKPAVKATYTAEDHQHLKDPKVLSLFTAVANDLLALDPSVRCEYLKQYIAFKSETNFVDVVVQAGGILLSYVVPFAEIDDPHGLCRDVANKGRWGNGLVEAKLTDVSQLPYLMRFARQALNRQLGNEDEDL